MNAPFSIPTECDVIMEGGVTSGVVFPSFIARLAHRFDLRCIGGTSVGAVAASAAAAAQFWRNARHHAGNDAVAMAGFARLAALPAALQRPAPSGKSTLYSLFQPCEPLRRHFAVLSAALNRRTAGGRVAAGLGATIVRCWEAPLAGLAACVAAYALGQLTLLALAVAAVLAVVLLAVIQFLVTGYRALCRNKFGMCSGMGADAAEPALTPWLHALIQDIAYGVAGGAPLTFGDLTSSPKSISLAFMTTGLSERRAHRLPHDSADLLFRRSQLATLFPADVVAHLCRNGRAAASSSPVTQRLLHDADPQCGGPDADLYYLPAEDALPIVFAARLSLSFPLLLQAVPLYRLRYVEGDGLREGAFTLAPIWLSDGGLSSNFPMHFFDALLPARPAFGVALENTLAEGAPAAQRVKLPATNRQGVVGSLLSVHNESGAPSLFSFVAALLNTSRGWRDAALQRTPGYRDRIVRIRHTRAEGGLNLNMPLAAIDAMSNSGVAAADAIIERFVGADGQARGWHNHRWVRARSTLAVLQEAIAPLAAAWRSDCHAPSYRAMWEGGVPGLPASYKIEAAYRDAGLAFWDALKLGSDTHGAHQVSATVPRPRPTLEITPKSC